VTLLTFTLIVWGASLLAGFLGALTGLGGGVVIVPLLAIAMHVDLRYAMGASLVSVIATSSGAAAAYVREGYSNIRIGMLLEVATTLGALVGAFLTAYTPKSAIGVIFGVVLLYSAWAANRGHAPGSQDKPSDPLAVKLRLEGDLPTPTGLRHYRVYNLGFGFSLMGVAGVLSGLLGIGSGAFKVLAMDRVMRIPFKVSTTTSNFMIGVTAAASAGLYLHRGYIDPGLAMPVMLGVILGSLVGAKILVKAQVKTLRFLFSLVIAALGFQMIYEGIAGKL
jgi:uncharacterized membrane protein YfcA